MKKENRKNLIITLALLTAFVLWTAAIRFVNVEPIGPNRSEVGFATLNGFFHSLTGVHMSLYNITDWMGLIPIAFAFGFAVLGLFQWITRRRLRQVDYSILILGLFYVAVASAYMFFEIFAVNYRPVLINGNLEVSYPSSTTLLVLCVMPTALMQLKSRITHTLLRRCVSVAISAYIFFTVTGRLLSGVHWLTDIIGGILLSAGLVMMYYSLIRLKQK